VEKTENEIAKEILDAAFVVHTKLGPGLLESVYEVVLAHELRKKGVVVERQKPMPITYDGIRFEEGYRADLLALQSYSGTEIGFSHFACARETSIDSIASEWIETRSPHQFRRSAFKKRNQAFYKRRARPRRYFSLISVVTFVSVVRENRLRRLNIDRQCVASDVWIVVLNWGDAMK
jgi:hypothetical protein